MIAYESIFSRQQQRVCRIDHAGSSLAVLEGLGASGRSVGSKNYEEMKNRALALAKTSYLHSSSEQAAGLVRQAGRRNPCRACGRLRAAVG